jgi:AcrR family transcriptional regulator
LEIIINGVFLLSEVNLPKTKRGKETLDKILKAAEVLFSSQGYYNTSITDITRKANVALGTFYIYFKDKKSVFAFLINELSKSLRHELSLAIKECKSRYEAEYIGFKTFFEFVKQHRGLYKIVWEAQFVDKKVFRDYYEGIAKGYIERVNKAKTCDEVKKELDTETIVYCLIGIANFIGLRWVIWENEPVPNRVIEDMMKFIKEGAFN